MKSSVRGRANFRLFSEAHYKHYFEATLKLFRIMSKLSENAIQLIFSDLASISRKRNSSYICTQAV